MYAIRDCCKACLITERWFGSASLHLCLFDMQSNDQNLRVWPWSVDLLLHNGVDWLRVLYHMDVSVLFWRSEKIEKNMIVFLDCIEYGHYWSTENSNSRKGTCECFPRVLDPYLSAQVEFLDTKKTRYHDSLMCAWFCPSQWSPSS